MEQLDYDYLAKLVKKTQDGDSNAFAELYAATYQKEYRFAYQYVKDPYLAQDILQDLYIIVLKNIQTLKNPRLFISWLQQICFRLCFDAAKKQQKHAEELVYEDIRKLDVLEYASSSTPPPKKIRNIMFFFRRNRQRLWRRFFLYLRNMPRLLSCASTATWV